MVVFKTQFKITVHVSDCSNKEIKAVVHLIDSERIKLANYLLNAAAIGREGII